MANSATGEKTFPRHVEVVRVALAKALRTLGWEIHPASDGSIAAIWTSPVFRFKDDVKIDLVAAGTGSRVRVSSKSRVGRYDFGQNAKHIRDLFRAIEKAM